MLCVCVLLGERGCVIDVYLSPVYHAKDGLYAQSVDHDLFENLTNIKEGLYTQKCDAYLLRMSPSVVALKK